MFNALRDIRNAEEEQAALYDKLLAGINALWYETRGLRSGDQQKVEFSDRAEDKPVDFSLESEAKGLFVLTVSREEGLPGVSFLGGASVDCMVYNLPHKLEKAEVSCHRKYTGEQQTVTPKKDATAFWKEISSLQEAGIGYMQKCCNPSVPIKAVKGFDY